MMNHTSSSGSQDKGTGPTRRKRIVRERDQQCQRDVAVTGSLVLTGSWPARHGNHNEWFGAGERVTCYKSLRLLGGGTRDP